MTRCNDDPTLTEMLADPLVGSVMAADLIDREELATTFEEIGRALARRNAVPETTRAVEMANPHLERACFCV